ncbi:hypothetical protein MJO29_002235 [Puccinia striiformis f. sp. tritici]|uniref:Rgp1-domain-containing protein n=1 Tax=Puccinia striiformis f. sp. tritici PST-78 TaxID=1165861 RepID=A0A0L0W3F2_9BASI|nr:hypothetical protein MJO29_002235 [Puccinia striiformis f. sp. tritici]KNF05977.1 hypothetical protein PSTG_00970 [Puccinia striiformis f. sp. tritici PST-78]
MRSLAYHQDKNSRISVTVRPNKSAYFAGEKFECTIEFKHHQHSLASANEHHQTRRTSLPSRLALIGTPPTTATTTLDSIAESSFPNPSFSFPAREPVKTPNSVTFPKPRLPFNDPPTPSTANSACPRTMAEGQDPDFTPRRASLQHPSGTSAPPHQTGFPSSGRRTASTATPSSSTALLGWTYCQLEGSFEVHPKHCDLDQFKSLRKPLTRGGGRLLEEEEEGEEEIEREGEGNKRGGVDQLRSGNGITKSSHSPSPSWISWLFGTASNSHHSTSSSSSPNNNNNNRFPVFENPISLLDVDVRLEPGQTRSYSFVIDLPINLPPTHKGKLIKFNYELIVGTNLLLSNNPTNNYPHDNNRYGGRERTSHPSLSADPFKTGFEFPNFPLANYRNREHHKNRTFRIPIRVFNHVYLNETKPFYDLFKPIILTREIAQTRRIVQSTTHPKHHQQHTTSPSSHSKKFSQTDGGLITGLTSLERYGLELLKSVPCSDPLVKEQLASVTQDDEWAEELENGCITAVEIVSRSAPKVSFDIMKDGRLVAHLTIVKSTYRLGETIEGTIEMNGSAPNKEGGRVLKCGISLETVETLKSSTASQDTTNKGGNHEQQSLRTSTKIYSEMEELVIDTSRTKFSLVIPSDGSTTPQFETSLVSLHWAIKLRLQFIPSHLPPPPSPSRTKTHQPSYNTTSIDQSTQSLLNPSSSSPNINHHHHLFPNSYSDLDHQSLGATSVYSHLTSHSIEEGTFKPVSQLGRQQAIRGRTFNHERSRLSGRISGPPMIINRANSLPNTPSSSPSFSTEFFLNRNHNFSTSNRDLKVGDRFGFVSGSSNSSNSGSGGGNRGGSMMVIQEVDLVVDFLECCIPVHVLPGNTQFNPPVLSFDIL